MAQPTTFKGQLLQIRVDNGLAGTNQAYAHPCMINAARGFDITSSGQDENIPDCADPGALSYTTHTKAALSATITGGGILDATNYAAFHAWMITDDPKTIKVDLNGTVGGIATGPFKLTQLGITGNLGERVQVAVTMKSDGAWTYGTA